MKKYLPCLLLISSTCFAGDLGINYGLGLDGPEITDVKFFSASYKEPWVNDIIYYKGEIGFWADSKSNGLTRNSSAFGSGSVGVEIRNETFYVSDYFGLAGITATDNYTSSPYEFQTDLGLGFKDSKTKAMIGAEFKHFSNAGIVGPNLGRDFITIKVQVPFL